MNLVLSRVPSTHFHVHSVSVSVSPIHEFRLKCVVNSLFTVRETQTIITLNWNIITLIFYVICHSHTHLFLFAVDNHQVCTSLQTVISTVLPGFLNRRNVIDTVVEIQPSLLGVMICWGYQKWKNKHGISVKQKKTKEKFEVGFFKIHMFPWHREFNSCSPNIFIFLFNVSPSSVRFLITAS